MAEEQWGHKVEHNDPGNKSGERVNLTPCPEPVTHPDGSQEMQSK